MRFVQGADATCRAGVRSVASSIGRRSFDCSYLSKLDREAALLCTEETVAMLEMIYQKWKHAFSS